MFKILNNNLNLLTKQHSLLAQHNCSRLLPLVVQQLLKKREYSSASSSIMEKFDLPTRLQGSTPSVW